MKPRHEEPTVAHLTASLRRSRLLAPEDIELLYQRWQQEADDADEIAAYTRWLVANRYVTEFQVALLLHGQADHFFLGAYKLLERIGRGRLATVYKAVHRLGHFVAIKVLPPSLGRDPRVSARFQHEAALARQLSHPHVVHALENGVEGGLHYLVMEYLEGETLQKRLEQRGRLPFDEAANIVRQAMIGLGHLHTQGLVHRNLEPANLMLLRPTEETNTGRLTVKILDISLARTASEVLPPSGSSSKGDDVLTLIAPQYRAPEIARDPSTADIRADIYTLGCVLYHALAGRPPFADPDPIGQMIRHATDSPSPLRQINPDVPEGLEQIVGWMLTRDPARRYQTPERAALALECFLQTATATRPDPAPEAATNSIAPIPGSAGSEDSPSAGPKNPRPAQESAVGAGSASAVWSAVVDPDAVDETLSEDILPKSRNDLRRPRPDNGLSRREYWLLFLGGAGLLVAELIGWLVARLLRPVPNRPTHD